MRRQVGLTLPDDLVNRLDAARGDLSRARAIELALEQYLKVDAVSKPAIVPPPKSAYFFGSNNVPSTSVTSHSPRCTCGVCKPNVKVTSTSEPFDHQKAAMAKLNKGL